VAWSVTGPALRGSGVAYDVRKAFPYSGYDQYEFNVPTRTEGDAYARFLVRLDEMEESIKIIAQAREKLRTPGP
jgi:NADH-quinone oxidoreductase subunit D